MVFSALPTSLLGVRSLRITAPVPTLQPRQIIVDLSDFPVPSSKLNYFGIGSTQTLSYVTGSVSSTDPPKRNVIASLKSTYAIPLQLGYITVSWTGTALLNRILLNGTPQKVPNLSSGIRTLITSTMVVPPYTDINTIELDFDSGMGGVPITVVMEWITSPQIDVMSFTL